MTAHRAATIDERGVDRVAEQSPLGGLERWLDDPAVSEVIVNGGSEVWVERDGRLQRVGVMREQSVLTALEHILGPIGRRLDRSSPMVDARLPDGSRVCAVIRPVAVDGPALAIRRFAVRAIALPAFAGADVEQLLAEVIRRRCNVLISGATASGKTTLLNALAGLIGADERLITLEDVAELRLQHPHVVRLETRPLTPDGVGEVTLADLLRTALRMRPERLIIGEIRGAEAGELLQALNTGHDGSLATIHANSAIDAVTRLAQLVLQHAPSWPLAAIDDQVRRSVDVVVHVARTQAGARQVVEVLELDRASGAPLGGRPLARDQRCLAALTRARR